MDELKLIPKRDPKKMWNDPDRDHLVNSPESMEDVTGLSPENRSNKMKTDYFNNNKFVEKFVGKGKGKTKVVDMLGSKKSKKKNTNWI